jgi:hypothetical protein
MVPSTNYLLFGPDGSVDSCIGVDDGTMLGFWSNDTISVKWADSVLKQLMGQSRIFLGSPIKHPTEKNVTYVPLSNSVSFALVCDRLVKYMKTNKSNALSVTAQDGKTMHMILNPFSIRSDKVFLCKIQLVNPKKQLSGLSPLSLSDKQATVLFSSACEARGIKKISGQEKIANVMNLIDQVKAKGRSIEKNKHKVLEILDPEYKTLQKKRNALKAAHGEINEMINDRMVGSDLKDRIQGVINLLD